MYDFIFFTDVTDTLLIYKPIGAYKCANVLRQQGYKVLVVDHLHTFSEKELCRLMDMTVSPKTKAVGFSSTFLRRIQNMDPDKPTEFEFMSDVNEHYMPRGPEFEENVIVYLKQINSKCKVILGGVLGHPNIKNRTLDYCVLGYGETSIINLANHLAKDEPLQNAFTNQHGVVILDNKKAEGYDFQNSTFRWEDSDVLNHRILPLEVSRGCIFKCSFCSYPMIGKKKNDYIRPADNLAREMQDNYDRFKVRHYYILDDTFNDNEIKIDTMLAAIGQLTFQPIFWAYTRLDLLTTRGHVDKLYAMGQRGMYFGIESLNPQTTKAIKKGHNRDLQVEQIRYIRKRYGDEINMNGSFIAGLPYESVASITDTFTRLHSGDIPLHSYRFGGLALKRADQATWSSELAREYWKFGYEVEPAKNDDLLGMKWKNEHMDRQKAFDIGNAFTFQAQQNPDYHLSDQTGLALVNYGYEMEDLRKVKYHQIDWADLERNKKVEFVDTYKKKLFDYLEHLPV